jgi:hypothetical protein
MSAPTRFDENLPEALTYELAALPMQRIGSRKALGRIAFANGLATVMVDARLLRHIAFKNDDRGDPARIAALRASIRAKGYQPRDPVICRIGQKGKWIVVDGGHRLTALQQEVDSRWRLRALRLLRDLRLERRLPVRFRRWLRRPDYVVYFILFTGARSLTKL